MCYLQVKGICVLQRPSFVLEEDVDKTSEDEGTACHLSTYKSLNIVVSCVELASEASLLLQLSCADKETTTRTHTAELVQLHV